MRCSCSRIVILLTTLFLGFFVWDFGKVGQHHQILEYHISSHDAGKLESGRNCTTDTCLHLLSCSLHGNQLTVFIEPLIRVIDEVFFWPISISMKGVETVHELGWNKLFTWSPIMLQSGRDITPLPSNEYLEIRSVIERSKYRVNAIEDACLVVPGFDTLNIYRFNDGESSFSKNFNAGARLNNYNVLIFTFAGASLLDINAIIARFDFFLW